MGNSEAKKKKQEEQQLKKMEEDQKKISIAVHFLRSEQVQKISQVEKTIFLRKKGLNKDMVAQAFKRYNQAKVKDVELKNISLPSTLLQSSQNAKQVLKNNPLHSLDKQNESKEQAIKISRSQMLSKNTNDNQNELKNKNKENK